MSPTTDPDPQRIGQIRHALSAAQLDAVVCGLPANVLMLSGYWPVVGSSICIADAAGRIVLIVPEDEEALARHSRADDVRTFKAGSLDKLQPVSQALAEPFHQALRSLGGPRIGLEQGETSVPASYAGRHLFGQTLSQLLPPNHQAHSADAILERLREFKTIREISRIRAACHIAAEAFALAAGKLRPGLSELQAANLLHAPLREATPQLLHTGRVEAFAFCMSGPNAAEAQGAYQRCRPRLLQPGDLVLMHCNSCVHGYWTDITRTYFLGSPTARIREMYDAVLAARAATLQSLSTASKGRDADLAARRVMDQRGFGSQFTTPLGHGVGFAAIDHNALPRLHPKSDDRLETGSVFNVEPGIYVKGECGMRHCDMVALTPSGAELLTDFQSSIDALLL